MNFKDKIRVIVIVVLAIFVVVFMYKIDSDKNKITATKSNTKVVETMYNPTSEEKSVLKKSYEELIDSKDYTIYSDLDKKYDSMSDGKRQSIKGDIERLRNEKTTYDQECEKQKAQNEQVYLKFTNEIESSYPSMKISSILGKDDKKSLIINMKLLHNLSSTNEEACKLAVMKETRMKEIGIRDITITLQDSNGKSQGILAFKLDNGQYKPYASIIN